MAVSAFQKVINQLLQQFVKVNGRNPQTPKEMMDIQNEAVQFFNRTKGVTPGPKKPPFQGFTPRVIEGGKGSKKDLKKTVEDFRDDGDFDPGGMAGGGLVKGGKWFLKSLKDSREQMKSMEMSPDQLKYYLGQIDDQIKNIEAGGQIPEEIIQTIRKDPKFKSLSQTKAQDPDLREMEEVLLEYGQRHASGGLAYMLGEPTYMRAGGGSVGHGPWTTGQVQPQQPQPQQAPRHHAQGQPNPMKMPQGLPSAAPRNMDPRVMQQQAMQKAMMGQQRPQMQEGGPTPEEFWNDKNYNQMRRLMDEYEQYKKNYDKDKQRRSGIEEAADGGRIGLMYGGDPGFQFEYGGSWADWHDQHKNQMPVEDYIQTKMPKERLPFRAAEGGRIGFKLGGFNKARRAFLKMLGGLTAGGIAAGTGILKLGTKAAPKVIKEAEVIARGADGTPKYIYDLIEVVKAKGVKKIMDSNVNKMPDTVHTYKNTDVIEDAAGDVTQIRKDINYGSDNYMVNPEIHMSITKGKMQVTDEGLKTQKSFKEADEFEEVSVTPDMDGKMKDVDFYVDDQYHLEFKEIADEAKDLFKIKKASGGLAHMLGE